MPPATAPTGPATPAPARGVVLAPTIRDKMEYSASVRSCRKRALEFPYASPGQRELSVVSGANLHNPLRGSQAAN
jgi:hypothetical protein